MDLRLRGSTMASASARTSASVMSCRPAIHTTYGERDVVQRRRERQVVVEGPRAALADLSEQGGAQARLGVLDRDRLLQQPRARRGHVGAQLGGGQLVNELGHRVDEGEDAL